MTACRVVCSECVTETGPKRWRYLCVDCAEEKQTEHRRETGHAPELFVAQDDLYTDVIQVAQRFGW